MKGSKKESLAPSLLASIIMLCIFSFISCSETSVTAPVVQSDDFLQKGIIGTWGVNGYRITYYTDGSFIDSTKFQPVETKSWKADNITKGSYRIVNGVIYYYNVDIVYLADNVSSPIGEGRTGAEINISNNVLSLIPVDILTPNGKTNGISGDWTTKKWLTTYNSESAYRGYLNCEYQMDNSNSTYTHQIEFLDDPHIKRITDQDLYNYTPPYLKLVVDYPLTVKVEFKNGLMYWYDYNEKLNLYKE